jgi:hypothetical protein
MALKYPLATGVWSNATNWNDGTLPVAGDDVRANGFTVTIDVDINVLQISTAQLLPAAAGGGFSVSTNRNITANIIAGTTTCLGSIVGNIVTIIGNIFASATNIGVSFTNAGSILNVTGNANGSSAIGLLSWGTVNFVGNSSNLIGTGSGVLTGGININSGGVLNFTGNATSLGRFAFGIVCNGSSTLNGTITGGNNTDSAGVRLNTGIHIVNSNCFGGTLSGCHGLLIVNSTVTVNGNCTGGSTTGSHAVQIANSTATFNGSVTGSSTSSGSLAINVTDSVSNVVVSQITFGSLGTVPVSGFVKFKNIGPTITVLKANSTTQQLVDPATTDIPAEGDVRDGIVYASGALTGTLAVPTFSAVSVGVPTDNGVGTAVITITDMGTLLASFQV